MGFPGGSVVNELAASAGGAGSLPGLGRPAPTLEKEMATHSRILAWKIPLTGEPGQLQFTGVTKEQLNTANNNSPPLLPAGNPVHLFIGVSLTRM